MTNKGWADPNIKGNKEGTTANLSSAYNVEQSTRGAFGRDDVVSLPTIKPISTHLDEFYKQGVTNKYDIYREMRTVDPELNGAIKTISMMVSGMFDKVWIEPEPGREFTDEEKLVLKEGQDFASLAQMDFQGLFASISDKLIQNGDFIAIKRYHFGDKRLPISARYWKPLPMAAVTAVKESEEIQNWSAQIWDVDWYVLNESTGENQQTWFRDEIVHITLNNYANEVYDNVGRYTFGIWSKSLLEPLQTSIKWKWNAIQNDIKWRHASVPRMHVKVDTSAFTPEKYEGTSQVERVRAARTAMESYMKDIRASIEDPAAEQGLITDKETEIDYVEPKTTTYASPNFAVDQQNKDISAATGVPQSLIGGKEESFSSMFISSSFATMQAEIIFGKIAEQLTELTRDHLRRRFMFIIRSDELLSDIVGRIHIKRKEIFLRDRMEQARIASTLAGTGAFTPNEIREIFGKDPLSADELTSVSQQWGDLTKSNKLTHSPNQTSEDVSRRTAPSPNASPSENDNSDYTKGTFERYSKRE